MKFRVEQRKNDSVDMTLMRAFEKAVPLLKRQEAVALARWMLSKAEDRRTKFAR